MEKILTKWIQRVFPAIFLILGLPVLMADDRSYDGFGNNVAKPEMGAAHMPFRRGAPSMYGDGMASLGGATRPNPRMVSNMLSQQSTDMPHRSLSDMVWLWGQFVDHDITLVPPGDETAMIPVPPGDPSMDPMGTGAVIIPFTRSEFMSGTGDSTITPRAQMNENTAFLDASMVYGSDVNTAFVLRAHIGGNMRMDGDGMLLRNTLGLEMDNPLGLPQTSLFASGDARANEHAGLLALHTLFSREHNRLVAQLVQRHPGWSDEQLYQRARKWVGALVQVITYREWLPALLGPAAPSHLGTYDPEIDPTIANEFATAIYRVGHTMINTQLPRIRNDNLPAIGGDVGLRHAFFNPSLISSPGELDYFLKGLCARPMQRIDPHVVEDVRDFLFGPPGAGGLDLVALNIQRGRDHGIADYNTLRTSFGLAPATRFSDITSDPERAAKLQLLYGSVNDIDPWIGAMSEDHLPDAEVGELLATAIADQFIRLRDGDRFYYRWDDDFSAADLEVLEATTLRDIIVRNTSIRTLQDDVFRVIPRTRIEIKSIARSDFRMRMVWPSHASASYQVEVASDMDAESWTPIGSPVAGNGVENTFDSGVGSPPFRFWRLRQFP